MIDHPGKWLKSEGLAIFDINTDPILFRLEDKSIASDFSGFVMFALWHNDSFTQRLADTGWIRWDKPFRGYKQAGLDRFTDNQIRSSYSGRMDVWENTGIYSKE